MRPCNTVTHEHVSVLKSNAQSVHATHSCKTALLVSLNEHIYDITAGTIDCGENNHCIALSYLTTRESLIGHSGWALPHYTEMGHSSNSFLGTTSPVRGSNPRPPVPMALHIPEGHRGIGENNQSHVNSPEFSLWTEEQRHQAGQPRYAGHDGRVANNHRVSILVQTCNHQDKVIKPSYSTVLFCLRLATLLSTCTYVTAFNAVICL